MAVVTQLRPDLFRGAFDSALLTETDNQRNYQVGNWVAHNSAYWKCVAVDGTAMRATQVPDESSTQWIRIDGTGGTPTPHPVEHFTFTLAGTGLSPVSGQPGRYHIAQDTAATSPVTITATVGVTGQGFVYDGFTATNVNGVAGNLATTPQAGTAPTNQFTFGLPITVAGTQSVSCQIDSENAAGMAIAGQLVTSTIQIVAPTARWYSGTTADSGGNPVAPTTLSQLNDNGPYSTGVSSTFAAAANNTAWLFLPDVANRTYDLTYTRSGFFFEALTEVTPAPTGFSLYRVSKDDYNGSGPIGFTVNSTGA